jgi:hypothetical protein
MVLSDLSDFSMIYHPNMGSALKAILTMTRVTQDKKQNTSIARIGPWI